ncbi:NAD(P)-binding protein [Saccharata proteae CBS 121410]|uniref:NAD(P)-binding protein n=1 Tax=Saccharata proteae CBS 121410 TaxID=1314787 RepID=A0A9P4HRJ7_9PEZI|nr:NAD(P)-binding protein [Saccharata proteae CBS 121410]
MSAAGKVIILTGASRGIGLAVAHFLLQKQCNLVVVARSREPLDRLRNEYPGQVQVLSGDLADFSLGKKAVDLALDAWSKLDGLIVNHGVLDPVKRIADADPEEWRKAFDVNVFSAVAMVKAALPSLRSSKGRIVLTSSGASTTSYSTWGSYGASKAVLNHLAQTLKNEEPDVTTMSIRPGVVDTAMQADLREIHTNVMDPKDAEKFRGLKSSGALLRPEQPGNVMARLVLDAPKELSGAFLNWNDHTLAEYQDA